MDQNQNKKLVMGWFCFTCSEDSTIILTELLNDHLDDWKKLVEFRHLKILKSKNSLLDLDVAFVEGAISSQKQVKEVIKIRENSKYVVAVGSCACTGMPSSSRNAFVSSKINQQIKWYINQFDYSQKVQKLSDVIKVDDMVPGCPMDTKTFMEILNKYLKIYTTT